MIGVQQTIKDNCKCCRCSEVSHHAEAKHRLLFTRSLEVWLPWRSEAWRRQRAIASVLPALSILLLLLFPASGVQSSSLPTWKHPSAPQGLIRHCFPPLHRPSMNPPNLCHSNATHKSIVSALLSWNSAVWFATPTNSLLLPIRPNLGLMQPLSPPLPSSSLTITHTHTSPQSPFACSIQGNLHLSSCPCWSHFSNHFSPPASSPSHLTIALEGFFSQTHHLTQLACFLGCAPRPLPNTSVSYHLHMSPTCSVGKACHETIIYQQAPSATVMDCEMSLELVYPLYLTINSFSVRGLLSSLRRRTDPLYFAPLSLSALYLPMPSRFRHSTGHVPCQDVDHNRWETHPVTCEELMQVLEDLRLFMDYEDPQSASLNAHVLGPFTASVPNMTVAKAVQIHGFSCKEMKSHLRVRFFLTAPLSAPAVVDGTSQFEYLLKSADQLTVFTEGIVNRTSGKLCLIACALKPLHLRATNASNRENDYNCNIRVNLQINSYINITLRWLVEGRLYSTIADPHNESYFAELKLQSYWPLNGVHEHKVARPITYIYTWIDEIHNRLRANGTSGDRLKLNHKYPTSSGQDLCLTDLAHQLRLDAVSSQFIMKRLKKSVHLKLDVIAVESCVILEGYNQPRTEYYNVTQSNLLRMGVEMWLDAHHIVAEGLYNKSSGTMLLMGCILRNAFAKSEVSINVSNKLDCSLLITVQFPPMNSRWLQRKWEVNIASTRSSSDKIFFEPIQIYGESRNREDRSSKMDFLKRLESGLHLFLFCGVLYCILIQLAKGKRDAAAQSFISLTMITLQGAGVLLSLSMYLVLLVGHEHTQLLPMKQKDAMLEVFDALVNIMKALVCLALSFIFYNVSKARRNKVLASNGESFYAIEYCVIEICMPFFIGILIVCLMVGAFDTMGSVSMCLDPKFWRFYVTRATRWCKDLRSYGEILQELFLMPQVVQNMVWKARKGSLRPEFYGGITALQVALRLYHIWQWEVLSADLNWCLAVECILPSLALLLAVIVRMQQTSDKRLWCFINTGIFKLLSQKKL